MPLSTYPSCRRRPQALPPLALPPLFDELGGPLSLGRFRRPDDECSAKSDVSFSPRRVDVDASLIASCRLSPPTIFFFLLLTKRLRAIVFRLDLQPKFFFVVSPRPRPSLSNSENGAHLFSGPFSFFSGVVFSLSSLCVFWNSPLPNAKQRPPRCPGRDPCVDFLSLDAWLQKPRLRQISRATYHCSLGLFIFGVPAMVASFWRNFFNFLQSSLRRVNDGRHSE